jgi:hypothetical protein
MVVGVGLIGTTTTDTRGAYSFSTTVSNTTAFQTGFGGATVGTHPNERFCAASISRVLRVRVRGGHGPGTSVLGAEGSAGSGTAFTGLHAAALIVLVVVLLVLGTAATAVARRRA